MTDKKNQLVVVIACGLKDKKTSITRDITDRAATLGF